MPIHRFNENEIFDGRREKKSEKSDEKRKHACGIHGETDPPQGSATTQCTVRQVTTLTDASDAHAQDTPVSCA